MGFRIDYDGDETELLEHALRAVAGWSGVVDIDHTDPDFPAGVSVIVLGVDLGSVQVVPYSDEAGGRDDAADPFRLPVRAITDLHIY